MSKILLCAREKILSGVRKLCELVRLTLGPKGRNVILDRAGAEPLVTNDGVTIAREAVFEDAFENLGARVLLQASAKTNEQAGDGTTSAVVLAAELLTRGSRRTALGESPVVIKEGLLAAAEFCVDEAGKAAVPVKTADEIYAVAANSCANEEWGRLVSCALERVGTEGVVTIEDSHTGRTALSFTEGTEVEFELASPYLCENQERLETVFEDARLLLTDQKVSSVKEILPVLELAVQEKFALVIVADDFSSEVTAALILNKVRVGLRIAALRNCVLYDRRGAVLGDIAALTGAAVVSKNNDLALADVRAEHLGTCRKIICGIRTAKLFSGGGESLEKHILSIKGQIKASGDAYNRQRLSERLAKLTNGIAVISVGAATEIEQKECRLRIEDALSAARSAAEEGIVPGGGLTYLNVAKVLSEHIKEMPERLRAGAEIMCESLGCILRQVCENAGVSYEVAADKISGGGGAFGYDAMTGRYRDLAAAGIVDPAKVVKCVIRNAASVAATLLTTEAAVAAG